MVYSFSPLLLTKNFTNWTNNAQKTTRIKMPIAQSGKALEIAGALSLIKLKNETISIMTITFLSI
jgi:hypothetical protein